MTDFRKELQFGIFVTPDAAKSLAVLELAKLADVVGLDLVTFQDHPYQARFLDTWTLLSVVAAQTSGVRVAPNVANLPLRQPVVLAQRRQPGHPERGSSRARAWRGSILGRDCGGRGAQAHPGSGRRCARRGSGRDSRGLVAGRRSGEPCGSALPRRRRAAPDPRQPTRLRSGLALISGGCWR